MTLQSIKADIYGIRLASSEGEITFSPFGFELSDSRPCCCVVGESGSGKTTFFKSLIPRFVVDWREHSHAEVNVNVLRNGIDIFQTNGRIGYAAQRPFFISHLTVRQNLLEPFRWGNRHIPTPTSVDNVIQDFLLDRLVDRRAYQLSAGERQRLNLARMFLARPEFAMIDECLSPMDEELARKVATVIVRSYARTTRLLITGHRKQDLVHFSNDAMIFSYQDQSGVIPVRQVNVTMGTL